MTTKLVVIGHRGDGHAERVAACMAAAAAARAGVEAVLLNTNEAMASIDTLATCDTMVFGAPGYPSGVASFKAFRPAPDCGCAWVGKTSLLPALSYVAIMATTGRIACSRWWFLRRGMLRVGLAAALPAHGA